MSIVQFVLSVICCDCHLNVLLIRLNSALGILMIGSALGGKSILYYIDAHFLSMILI